MGKYVGKSRSARVSCGLESTATPAMYGSVGFWRRDPSTLWGGGETSQCNLMAAFTGLVLFYNPDTLSKGNHLGSRIWISNYKCCYSLHRTFLLWKGSLVSTLHTGILVKLFLRCRGCREGSMRCSWDKGLWCLTATVSHDSTQLQIPWTV